MCLAARAAVISSVTAEIFANISGLNRVAGGLTWTGMKEVLVIAAVTVGLGFASIPANLDLGLVTHRSWTRRYTDIVMHQNRATSMLRRSLLTLTVLAAFVGVVGSGVARPAHAYVPDGYAHASDAGPGEAR